jgi:deoxyribodipyrimidine photo-lyase
MNNKRVRVLNKGRKGIGPAAYWMSRDQRIRDNWALLYAQEKALGSQEPLIVLFCLVPEFLKATIRQYAFMLKGLQQVEKDLSEKNIPFYFIIGRPDEEIPRFVKQYGVSSLITDFDPLRIKQEWKKGIAQAINIPFYEVDTHNVVPVWIASQKQEYGAYTFRPKFKKLITEFLYEFPEIRTHPFPLKEKRIFVDWNSAFNSLKVDHSVSEVKWITPGEKLAIKRLHSFINDKLSDYHLLRNDPTKDAQSDISPYLHFGNISAQRAALEVRNSHALQESKDAFLEELLVRRELSDNFCFYNILYDSFDGFPQWAQKTLNKHRQDNRHYMYSCDQFEKGETHDDLWNAAQNEMVRRGKMNGYMRMYWAKKILEWTDTPEQALDIAIYLNDRYELDGRDPNGYTGIAWSIGGVHDRAWKERDIFGSIRYMSYNGCRSKFNVSQYIKKVRSLKET